MKRPGCFAFVLCLLGCVGEDAAPPGAPTNGSADGGTDGAGGGGGPDGGPPECTTPARCSEDARSLVTCNASEPCPLGCDLAAARCKALAPSGAAGAANTAEANATSVLDAANTYWFDMATGIIGFRDDTATPTGVPLRAGGTGVVSGIGFDSVTQSDGSKIGVWSFRSLTIARSAVVKVFGGGAVALVTQKDLLVDGTIAVRGDCEKDVPGPGAAPAASARSGKQGETKLSMPQGYKYICAGGGGGGNGSAGGDGGWAAGTNFDGVTFQSLGGARGTAREKTMIDEPLLVGGGTGGSGGNGMGGGTVVDGGVGGGAVQLVSSGKLTVSGVIDAGGCGGKRGFGGATPINTHSCRGAGGGGAGGAIFLEAPLIHVTASGRVLANGGGGGGGSTSYTPGVNADGAANGVDGSRALGGAADARRATDGSCSPGQNGNVPADGSEPFANPCVAGDIAISSRGGGGGFGSIAMRTMDATFSIDEGGVVNPAPARSIAAVK